MEQKKENQNDAQVSNTIISQDKLTEYCVYEHPLLPKRIVKQGFCWPALIVGPAYLIYRKLWVPLVVWFVALGLIRYFAINLYPNYLHQGSDADTVEIIYTGAFFLGLLILGGDANSLWKNDLMKRGYVKTKFLFARSMDDALAIIEREKIIPLGVNQHSTNHISSDQGNDQSAQRPSVIKNLNWGWMPSGFSMFALLGISIFIVVVISSVRSKDSSKADQERQAHEAIVAQNVKIILDARKKALPNPVITPGAINPSITQENIQQTLCVKGYTKTIRPPAQEQKIRAYGYADTNTIRYEEDHLIALSIGGSPDDSRNLWPQPRDAKKKDLTETQIFWNAEKKDQLEMVLYKKVCAQEIPLAEAQNAMATNWIDAWQKYVMPIVVRGDSIPSQ